MCGGGGFAQKQKVTEGWRIGMPTGGISKADRAGGASQRTIITKGRYQIGGSVRLEEEDTRERQLVIYGSWISIKGRFGKFPLEVRGGSVSRWRMCRVNQTDRMSKWAMGLRCNFDQAAVRASAEERA